MAKTIEKCRACGSRDLVLVLDLGVQALTGVFPGPSDPDPPREPLQLALCRGPCGLLQLAHEHDPTLMYGDSYGYRSSLNETMVRHLSDKVGSLVRTAGPSPGDAVLDIGSNDGTLLKCYGGLGLRRVGVDPSAAKFAPEYPADADLIVDFFPCGEVQKRAGKGFRIVTSVAMFYDLDDPIAFMRSVRGVLARDGVWEFEQSYMPGMIENLAYDTVCHEHACYYGLRQIQWMAERSGLRIIDVGLNRINGSSFRVLAVRDDSNWSPTSAVDALLRWELAEGLTDAVVYEDFARRVREHRDRLREFLDGVRARGERVVGYGASTKGNVVIQYCGIGRVDVPVIAEKYASKYGRETPGSRIPIVSEEEARALEPDYMLVFPWHYRDEIVKREEAFTARGGRLVFPLPDMEVYP